MIFVLRMAMRELRASWRRLLFFFVCVAIGVGAIVAIRSIVQNVRGGLTREARSLIAADVLVQTNRPWDPKTRQRLDDQLGTLPIVARSESIETATMVRPQVGAAVARMVELRAVQDGFPFYGTIVLDGGRTFSHDLLRDHGVLVRPELLTQLAVKEGEAIVIGGQPFTIRGVIREELGRRAGAVSLGSRVVVGFGGAVRPGM